MTTDASSRSIGTVIARDFPDGTTKAIADTAMPLTSAERNYGQIEEEALGTIFAIKKFQKILCGRYFNLVTDHKPLLAMFGSKKGILVYTANRLQRWAAVLLGYNFAVGYASTDTIGQADALSRSINSHSVEAEDIVVASFNTEPEGPRSHSKWQCFCWDNATINQQTMEYQNG
ncbi:hypothetical protein EG68_09982 [Paragonimus skrjabini miyazakii]|uniref:Reverse transcriptase RNase H-like domain-containing protein n=1 Tax=Paragonimus skrjabini miyazakii TaxID=59628 RepID=A0A8S9YQ07_9TREM|nr:hypothetical protein EG68_09982 [Paragonimus skrjabini miyazakii]